MRGHLSCLASFFTQHTPATRSFRPLIICMGTPDSLISFTCLFDNLHSNEACFTPLDKR